MCCKNGNHLSRLDQSQNIPESGYWLLIGYVEQLDTSRNQRSRFFVFYGASGIQGNVYRLGVTKTCHKRIKALYIRPTAV